MTHAAAHTGERPRFAVFSDNLLAAEELTERLRQQGQKASTVNADGIESTECLVFIAQRPVPTPAELAAWARLANHAAYDVTIFPIGPDADPATPWPGRNVLRWTGGVADLKNVARTLVELFRPASPHFMDLPVIFAADVDNPGLRIVGTPVDLVDRISATPAPRVIPLAEAVFSALSRVQRASNRHEYDLIRLLRWNRMRRMGAFVKPRIARQNHLELPLDTPRALDDLVHDPLTGRLVVLRGEPGSGKTLQLRHLDAYSALQSIRFPDRSWRSTTFYVALSEQPAQPDITLDWLARRWAATVDTQRWIGFEHFLADGGVILLDGLNEGGLRSIPLENWMLQWRDVIADLLEGGASRAVVTCRTRDQLIPLGKPGGEPETSLTLLPLTKAEIVAVAAQEDPVAAQRLNVAMTRDPDLADLYASPFRLRAYLESRTSGVATTGVRLFGLQISAAILREREHLNFHGPMIPAGAAAGLARIPHSPDEDPWPVLKTIPLIGGLGRLAKELCFPTPSDGHARLAITRVEAAGILGQELHLDGDLALETAIDLHILIEERYNVRFAHPSLLHLFAAYGSSVDDIIELAKQEQRDFSPAGAALPLGIAPPSYTNYRYDEVYQFAAQFLGAGVPDGLVEIEPVLAARVYLSIKADPESPAAQEVVERLLARLDDVSGHHERSAMIAALGDLGWRLPTVRHHDPSALSQIPPGEWQLGMRSATNHPARGATSEHRLIELPGFRISRFPVSNSEYAEFIKDGGYDDKAYWTPEGWEWRMRSRDVEKFVAEWGRRRDRLRRRPQRLIGLLRSGRISPAGAAALVRFANLRDSEIAEHARIQQAKPVTTPRYWSRKAFSNPLQPVVGVSWFEANAFCQWLSRHLEADVRLASENEWEAACLHSLGMRSAAELADAGARPRGNTSDLDYPGTTPIGTFATHFQTQQGLAVEFIGNVFEWVFDNYAPGDHSRRILKGGSFRQEPWRAHPAYRGRGDVDTQNDDIGFRFVVSEGTR